jgi:oxygen-independent coproporphyrinogen III oxidase
MKRSLYLHIPFCHHKCNYCDFYSITNLDFINRFTDCICKEIEIRMDEYQNENEISSIFFGGGTPSILPLQNLEKIINSINKNFKLLNNPEFTLECNPGTIDLNKLKTFKEMGINRLSIGVQSFNEAELKFLERIHDSNVAIDSINAAREAGFDNFSIDLMFSLPNQTHESWKNNLQTALDMNIPHISAYSLTYEPQTPLYKDLKAGKVKNHSESSDARFFEIAMKLFDEYGYEHYEVSNYAKDGFKCQHNLHYWNCLEYFAFGPSAHGYLNNIRFWNTRALKEYLNKIEKNELPILDNEELTKCQQMMERVMLELRSEGIRINEFRNDFEIDLDDLLNTEAQYMFEHNYIQVKENKIKLTNKGFLICDELVRSIIQLTDNFQ